ncbi:sugar diacid utilization regulator [Vibrio vulnificus]|uniref:sugar diacid recognition domain-containing protein n=1 Tax=Vibrio vulnificus TaxID=672 RepID=UPI0007354CE0|nr:sugar diacid recognition domain-containing protein [Vibrio vulnificus]PNM97214.1 XRE family transcriptional regulator [Vibrio vulnificus]SUP40555.1 sugar diacid utilization regulator [Vibrio vulnificus]HAS8220208.1 XRE family transcriptional regulator [Vibrio vulnificus]HAS8274498.1 XRE family transcriptional regulator [Vibrio vulnificus]
MKLNETIARQIVERTMKIIPYSVNVMDEQGRIIGSGDPSRLQQKHEGAVLAITECRVVEIDKVTASHLKGVKPGINLPILFLDQVIGVIGVSGAPDEVKHYGELVKMTAELIVEQAALMSQVQWNKRHREELVLQLISGATLNDNQLNSIAERLGLNLSEPRIAAVVKVFPDKQTSLSLEHLQQIVHLLEYPERDNLVGILSVSNNEVVVLKPISLTDNGWSKEVETKRINQLLKRVSKEGNFSIKIALGDYFEGLAGLAQSFETAKLTMQLMAEQSGTVFFYQDHKLPVLMSDLLSQPWKAEQLQAPLLKLQKKDSKGVLLKTLTAYFAQKCDACRTCQALHIHRNTLRYRIEKIEDITSLNFNNLNNTFQLYIALELFSSKQRNCADAQKAKQSAG